MTMDKTIGATAVVSASLVALFLLPRDYFIAGTLVATSVMLAASIFVHGHERLRSPTAKQIAFGLLSAAMLYGLFYAGNLAIHLVNIEGLGTASESAIYSLIASRSTPLALQIVVLAMDALGFEAFFRGVLQKRLGQSMGPGAAPVVALFDSILHFATFNPLWVVTTFIADLVWGLTYAYGKGLPASMTSHLAWDLLIFVIRPIA